MTSLLQTITVNEFMAYGPCYSEDKIREIAGDKERWTALDILALDLSSEDRFWAVLREDLIPAEILHEFACRCAEQALIYIKKPDPRSVAAIVAKRAWLRGEIDDTELKKARAAAFAATWSANAETMTATRTAADAARDTARSAAWTASWGAAWVVARSAAEYDTAREAARDEQVEIICELFEEGK